MNTQKKYGRASLMALVALGLCAALGTGCAKQEPDPNRDPDRYGYVKTRDTNDDPSDNAAIRHEKRGHNRWRP